MDFFPAVSSAPFTTVSDTFDGIDTDGFAALLSISVAVDFSAPETALASFSF